MISFSAFTDELQKIATNAQELGNLEKKMRVGDVILTGRGTSGETHPWANERAVDAVESVAETLGGKYFHTGVYTGKGKWVDARPGGVRERSLSDLGRAPVRILSPRGMSSDERSRIAQRAQRRVGEPYGYTQAMKAYLASEAGVTGDKRREVHSVICSNLVADAYKGKADFGRAPDLVGPWDIRKSRDLKEVAHMRGSK